MRIQRECGIGFLLAIALAAPRQGYSLSDEQKVKCGNDKCLTAGEVVERLKGLEAGLGSDGRRTIEAAVSTYKKLGSEQPVHVTDTALRELKSFLSTKQKAAEALKRYEADKTNTKNRDEVDSLKTTFKRQQDKLEKESADNFEASPKVAEAGPGLWDALYSGGQSGAPSSAGGGHATNSYLDSLFGGSVPTLVQNGSSFLKAGDYQEAIAQANEAHALDPNASQPLSLRAAAELQSNDIPAAAADARAALALNPNDQQAQAVAGLAHQSEMSAPKRIGSFGSADAGAGPAAGANAPRLGESGLPGPAVLPASASSGSQLSQDVTRLLSIGDVTSALALVDKAIKADPKNAEAYGLRAMIHFRRQDYAAALKDVEKGLALSPGDAALLNTKAAILNRLKQYNDALAAADRAIDQDPKNAFGHYNRANAEAGLGNRSAMLDSLKRAASLEKLFRPILRDALQLPNAADLALLFDARGAAAGARAQAPARLSRARKLALAALAAGALLLLGMGVSRTRLAPQAAPVLRAPTPRPLAKNGATPEVLRGQYKVGKQIGAGGMGTVYEGTDIALNRRVAIKRMRDELKLDRRERERFVSEAKTVAALRHPHIVDIHAIVEDNDDIYLVFEHVAGQTVDDLIVKKGRLPFAEALGVLRSAAAAVEYAHSRGVIHRDLKPSNVMIDEEGRVRVMDFGVARIAKDAGAKMSMTGTVVGTPPYMAPEQEQGVVRRESDVYALTVCFYEMLCGERPFKGSGAGMLMSKINKSYVPASRNVSGLPEGIDEVFARALEPNPEARFSSAAELLAALDVFGNPATA